MGAQEQKSRAGWVSKLEELFGFDLRSLAVFRIGLAFLILADLIGRIPDLEAHYTDAGVLPRAPLIEQFLHPWFWSVHLFSGQSLFQGLLFLIAGLIAIALLVGYRTGFVTVASWALLVSLQSRNSMILNGGDIALRLLVFWSMFLPLGARYSVDGALNTAAAKLPKRILSGATIALTLQICFIYWFSVLFKSDPIWWREGSAVYYALSNDQIVTQLGRFLLNFPPLLVLLSFTTLWIEALGPLLLFVPFRTSWFRLSAVVLFVLLHLGFSLGLNIILFPYVCAVAWLVFTPSAFWDGIAKRLDTAERRGLQIYYDSECGFCKKTVYLLRTFLLLSETPLLLAQDDPSIHADMQTYNSWVVVDWQGQRHFKFDAIAYVCQLSPVWRFLTPVLRWKPVFAVGTKVYEAIASNRRRASRWTKGLQFRDQSVETSFLRDTMTLLLLAYVFLWNLRSYAPKQFSLPKTANWVGLVLRLDQKWNMFGPHPSKIDGWYVIPGQLKNGTEVDLFKNGQPVSWQKPQLISADYSSHRWRKYMTAIRSKKNASRLTYYERYLCRQWNKQHRGSEQLANFKIYFMRERTLPNNQSSKVDRVLISEHSCIKKSDAAPENSPAPQTSDDSQE